MHTFKYCIFSLPCTPLNMTYSAYYADNCIQPATRVLKHYIFRLLYTPLSITYSACYTRLYTLDIQPVTRTLRHYIFRLLHTPLYIIYSACYTHPQTLYIQPATHALEHYTLRYVNLFSIFIWRHRKRGQSPDHRTSWRGQKGKPARGI